MRDPYDDQLRAARYRAERDQAREELARIDGGAQAAHRTYGALSDEDRKILRWVRARGGLQEVRRRLKKSVPREAYERKRGAWRRHIRECEEALRKRNARIRELENAACERRTVRAEDREAAEWVREHGGLDVIEAIWDNDVPLANGVIDALWPGVRPDDCSNEHVMDELRERLMPEGMEWPRFEDGEFVRSGDRLIDDNGDWFSAVSFIFTCDWWCIEGYQQIGFGTLSRETKRKLSGMPPGDRVKRPAPKVLDADGAEIREKRDVWWICEGDERGVHAERLHVETICPNGLIECSPYNGGTWVNLEPSELYVNKPVPSSDGKPLREGERAYVATDGPSGSSLSTGDEVAVVIVGEDVTIVDDEGYEYIFTPDELTHERPDSWDRLEEDADKYPCEYFRIDNDTSCGQCPAYLKKSPNRDGAVGCRFEQKRDIVRRAKALAERGQ